MNYFRCGGGKSTHTATKIDVAKTPLATFESNVSGLYLPEILAYFSATQAGTGDPSPSNIRPISGVSEVTTACNAINQWDEQWELGAFDITGNPIPSTVSIRSKNYIPVKPSTSYYFLFNNSNSAKLYVAQYNARKEFISYLPSTSGIYSPRAFTTASDCSFIKLDFTSAYGTTYLNDCSINYPSTDTAYHAYTGTTATTALGGTYYGGYLNVTTGLLTVTDVRKDLGDIDWNAFDTTNKFIYTWNTLTPAAKPTANNNIAANMLCEIYPTLSRSGIIYSAPFKTGIAIDQTGNIIISDQNNTWSNINEAKAELTGHYVVYELATPQTVQLTPAQIEQLLGQNNVFCSSGDVAVKYWKID